jgi:two-component system, NtrC family, sensor kinase
MIVDSLTVMKNRLPGYVKKVFGPLVARVRHLLAVYGSLPSASSLSYSLLRRSIAITSITLAVILFILIMIEGANEWFDMRKKAVAAEKRISNEFALPLWNLDQGMIDTLLELEITENDFLCIVVYDNNGNIIKGVKKFADGSPIFFSDRLSIPSDGSLFTYKSHSFLTLYDKNFGAFDLFLTYKAAIKRMIIRTVETVFIFLIMTAIMFFVIHGSIHRKIITPVLDLAEVVRSFRKKDFSKRAQHSSNDELGYLALHINDMADTIEKYSRNLEFMVEERTSQLISAEKMAALGELVAGISHEINTPIGTAITAASFLEKKSKALTNQIISGEVRRSELLEYLKNIDDAMQLTLTNLMRASELIQSFKKVAVDRSISDRRLFKVKEYFGDIVVSLKPRYKRSGHTVEIEVDESLEMDSYPGDISQMMTNLIMNSLAHAYPDSTKKGVMKIRAAREHKSIIIVFSDDGVGIPEENLSKIYLPFFTTKRGAGGSGLGLNIVYNIVTQKLGGTIECRSTVGLGTTFIITIPQTNES